MPKKGQHPAKMRTREEVVRVDGKVGEISYGSKTHA